MFSTAIHILDAIFEAAVMDRTKDRGKFDRDGGSMARYRASGGRVYKRRARSWTGYAVSTTAADRIIGSDNWRARPRRSRCTRVQYGTQVDRRTRGDRSVHFSPLAQHAFIIWFTMRSAIVRTTRVTLVSSYSNRTHLRAVLVDFFPYLFIYLYVFTRFSFLFATPPPPRVRRTLGTKNTRQRCTIVQ